MLKAIKEWMQLARAQGRLPNSIPAYNYVNQIVVQFFFSNTKKISCLCFKYGSPTSIYQSILAQESEKIILLDNIADS